MTEGMTPETQASTIAYREVVKLVQGWLTIHKGETFDLDLICRHLDIKKPANRHYVATELSKLVSSGKLEKDNRTYRYIDTSIRYIDWVNASTQQTVPIKWPYGHEDGSRFGFDGKVCIPQGGVVIVGGVSNAGKSALCQGILFENMHDIHCVLMGNEYTGANFKHRIQPILKWANPFNGDGRPVFDLVERRSAWKDIIQPEALNIIDWINMGDNFYQIGQIIEGIQSKLTTGVVVIALQKDKNKTYAMGGMWGEHLACLYLAMDFGRIYVQKAKEWHEHNPNHEYYAFDIVDHGTMFHDIHRVKLCSRCSGRGTTSMGKCGACFGRGHVDWNPQDDPETRGLGFGSRVNQGI